MSVGAAIGLGAVLGLALGIIVSVVTDFPLAPEAGLMLGALVGWFCAGRAGRSCLLHGDAFELVLESDEPLTRPGRSYGRFLSLAAGDVDKVLFLDKMCTLATAPRAAPLRALRERYGFSENGG